MIQENKNISISAREALNIIKSYERRILDFDREKEDSDFVPARYKPKEDGIYLTIRCGLTGIYTSVNEWKNDNWQMNILDGSITIAYSRNKLNLW